MCRYEEIILLCNWPTFYLVPVCTPQFAKSLPAAQANLHEAGPCSRFLRLRALCARASTVNQDRADIVLSRCHRSHMLAYTRINQP